MRIGQSFARRDDSKDSLMTCVDHSRRNIKMIKSDKTRVWLLCRECCEWM